MSKNLDDALEVAEYLEDCIDCIEPSIQGTTPLDSNWSERAVKDLVHHNMVQVVDTEYYEQI